MERFKVESEVRIDGIGKCKDEFIIEFEDDLNVFGRALAYRQRMRRTFPNSEFRLIKATRIKEV